MNARRRLTRALCLLSILPFVASAQTTEDADLGEVVSNYVVDQDVFGGGIFYYQIIVDETAEVVAQGTMDVEGLDRIILAPQTRFRFLSFYAETLSFGAIVFTTPPAGRTFVIPCLDYELVPGMRDSDGDGLPDIHERIAGTGINNPDTDGDGFLDGAEVVNGQDPLDGFIVDVGIIATGPTAGPAVDICAINNLAVVAMGTAGISVFSVRSGSEPVRISQVNTPGTAEAVSCFGDLVVVADGVEGLAIIDISDPAGASIVRQIKFQQAARAVTSRGNFAYVGLDNGTIVMVDMLSGEEVTRFEQIKIRIQDLGIREQTLYALTVGTLHAIDIRQDDFALSKSVTAPGSFGAGGFRWRLFVGDDFLYASHIQGFNTYNISDPMSPAFLEQVLTSQSGWKHIVATGTGLAVATTSPNSTRDGPHHVDLYSVGEDNLGSDYLRTFETPGIATAVAIYNALAYIADDSGGLQVLNYASFDTAGIPPVIAVRHSGIDGKVEEGKILSIAVDVTDDVEVRNVQFFVDDEPVTIDGNFPFETGVIAPLITANKRTFQFYVIASDTGGNTTRSETVTLELVPDATPPFVRRFLPRNGSIIGNLDTMLVTFSEPIGQGSITTQSVTIKGAGGDGLFDTADDLSVSSLILNYEESTNSLSIQTGPLEPDLYRLLLATSIKDLAGNPLAAPETSSFRIFGFGDKDGDGVPDDLEELLGLDPTLADTDGDGIIDGDEDADNDGLSNTGEIVMGTDPLDPDSDGNGILDGDEDADFDGLTDGDEFRYRTDPFKVDTDGDGIDDATEIADGLDPLDPSSAYPELVVSETVSFINAITAARDLQLAVTIASPVLSYLNAISLLQDQQLSVTIAAPVVSFLNTKLLDVEPDLSVTFSSPIVSYRNAQVLEFDAATPLFFASAPVSYENQK